MDKPGAGEVLIVDDTPANLQLLAGMLEERGYEVRPMPSGPLALRAADAHPPDLILLDVNMPGMNGYEVCERLKAGERTRDIPVLFISALSEPLDKVTAFKVGGVDYVTKPFQIDEVQARIDTHVRLRRMQLELETKNRTIAASYDQLQKMELLRDTLTHMLAHDMRSPLTAILGALEFIKEDCASAMSPRVAEDFQQLEDSTRGLIGMISDFLDISRLEASQLPVARARCDLVELARAAVSAQRGSARGRDIDLSGMGAALELECDADLVRRVLANLLDNALKFTPQQGAVVLRARRDDREVRVEIEDSGPGIPAEMHARIFEKFGQAALGQQHRRYSTGLGLAFCRLAVEAHGGSIGVISEPGRGSTFWFTLPSKS